MNVTGTQVAPGREPIAVSTAPGRDPAVKAFYLPQLDLVRFVSFLAVFMGHAFPDDPDTWVKFGASPTGGTMLSALFTGTAFVMDLFFALSAYLITTLLLREVDLRGKVDTVRFYIRRALRIWPLYYLFIGVCYFFQNRIPDMHLKGAEMIPFLYFWGNYMIIRNPFIPIGHLWSTSVEEQFYLSWAFILRWIRVQWIPIIATTAIVVSVGTRLFFYYHHARFTFFWCGTLTRLDGLGMGILLATGTVFRKPLKRPWAWIVGSIVMMFLTELFLPLERKGPFNITVAYFMGALLGTIIVKAAIGIPIGRGPVMRQLCYLGKISFGFYVWHVVFVHLTDLWFPGEDLRHYTIRAAVALPMTIITGIISYEFFERYFLTLKDRFFTYVPSRPV